MTASMPHHIVETSGEGFSDKLIIEFALPYGPLSHEAELLIEFGNLQDLVGGTSSAGLPEGIPLEMFRSVVETLVDRDPIAIVVTHEPDGFLVDVILGRPTDDSTASDELCPCGAMPAAQCPLEQFLDSIIDPVFRL
jgi:hypothetical protein